MSMDVNTKDSDEKLTLLKIYTKLAEAEEDVREGRVSDAREGLRALREKYGL